MMALCPHRRRSAPAAGGNSGGKIVFRPALMGVRNATMPRVKFRRRPSALVTWDACGGEGVSRS